MVTFMSTDGRELDSERGHTRQHSQSSYAIPRKMVTAAQKSRKGSTDLIHGYNYQSALKQ